MTCVNHICKLLKQFSKNVVDFPNTTIYDSVRNQRTHLFLARTSYMNWFVFCAYRLGCEVWSSHHSNNHFAPQEQAVYAGRKINRNPEIQFLIYGINGRIHSVQAATAASHVCRGINIKFAKEKTI